MTSEEIIALLPYEEPFLFVDQLRDISEEGISGHYSYNKNAFFYKGHFKDKPVTPWVILTETAAQIGLVCLGIYLLRSELSNVNNIQIAFTSSQMDFYIPVLPGETVFVESEKQYFRFNKLKCNVKLFNAQQDLVCRGNLSGMIKLN
jgi:3-hydroxyacyl-[acyl-carrier-protein] dehydratase